jgi:hypothetical protein
VSAIEYDGAINSAPFTAAPANAEDANNLRDGMTSARLSIADAAVPATKPSCTIVVSHPA